MLRCALAQREDGSRNKSSLPGPAYQMPMRHVVSAASEAGATAHIGRDPLKANRIGAIASPRLEVLWSCP